MLYSVWDHGAKQYTYYEAPTASGTHAPAPPTRAFTNKLGATPEQIAWPLPAEAKKVGVGAVARGRIATTNVGFMGLSGVDGNDLPLYLIAAGLAYAAWRAFR